MIGEVFLGIVYGLDVVVEKDVVVVGIFLVDSYDLIIYLGVVMILVDIV